MNARDLNAHPNYFEITHTPQEDPLAVSVKLNGELRDVNRKLSRESVDLVNALDAARDYMERPYHPDNIKDAIATINAALCKWGREG